MKTPAQGCLVDVFIWNYLLRLKKTLDSVKLKILFPIFTLITAVAFSLTAKAQPSACGNINCTSNDVRIISAYISGPGNTPINCLDANPFDNAELHLIVSSNTQRVGISISATLNADNTPYAISHCFTGINLNSGSGNNLVDSLHATLHSVQCGDNFSLTNVFIAWGTGNTDFCEQSTDPHCPATPSKCRFVAGETITVTVKLNPDFTWQAGNCSQGGNSLIVDFTPSYTAENITPPLNYTWDFGDGSPTEPTSSDDNNSGAIQHTYPQPGTYTVTLTASDNSNPVVTREAVHKVTVTSCCDGFPAPNAAVTQPDCSTPTGTVTVTSPDNGVTYTLTEGAITYTADANGVFSGVAPGTYTFTASNSSCSSNGKDVTVNDAPATPNITGTPSVCVGLKTKLTGDGTPAQSNAWGSSDENVATVDNTGLVTGVAAGSADITYTNSDGCSTKVTVTVKGLPDVNAGTYGPLCVNNSAITLAGTPSGGTFSGQGVSGNSFDPSVAGVGTWTVTYVYSDATTGCSNTTTTSIEVNDKPTVSIDPQGPICDNAAAITLTGTPATGGTFSGDGVTGNQFNPSGLSPGAHTVTYSYTDGNNCSNSASTDITVNPSPNLVITNPSSVCSPSTVNITAAAVTAGSSAGTLTYWTDKDGTITLSNPGAIDKSGTYYIKLTNTYGCYVIKAVTVIVNVCTGIYPTATDCAGFNSGTVQFLPKVCVSTKTAKGKTTSTTVSNATPGVFFYYTKFAAPASTFSVTVTQTKCGLDKYFAISQTQVNSYSNSCVKLNATVNSTTNGTAVVTIKNATAGQPVIVSVKYDTKSIVGATIVAGFPCSYSFKATQTVSGTTTDITNSTTSILVTSNCSAGPITSSRVVDEAQPANGVTAYPNPYKDEIKFNIISPQSGNATLELYDFVGRRIAVVYQGYVQTGMQKTVNYSTPVMQHIPMIYRFKVGDKIIVGKLFPVRE